jgi:two-component system sensor histidine kinase/response regulator
MSELVLSTDLTAEQRDYMGTLQRSAESLLQILNDILDISKIEAGRMVLDQVNFSPLQVLEEARSTMSGQALSKGLELIAEWSELPERLEGDPMRLRQVLLNLIGNAVKFTQHGSIQVRATQVQLEGGEVELLFSVRDSGIGIPPEHQKLIFDAFAQADGSITRRFGGTGLGLAISQKIVETMGGRIWVESTVGQGSKFSFTAPFRVPVSESVPAYN